MGLKIDSKIELKILKKEFYENYGVPAYATEGSAGLDLRAAIDENLSLAPQAVCLIPTGLAVFIKNKNLAGMILPRSGLGHRDGIILGNSVGLIDSDYQGELKISLWNRGDKIFEIKPGMRIAQLVIIPIVQAVFDQVEDFSPTVRAEGGFGSSGKN